MVYLINLFTSLFSVFSILFFICVIFYVRGAEPIRMKILKNIGYKPNINSSILWDNVRKEYYESKKYKQAYFAGFLARVLFVLMWLSVLAQVVNKDIY